MEGESSFDLIGMLESLGITSIFSEATANLSGISHSHLFVSSLLHKTVLTIDEEGTKAAAVTAPVCTRKSARVRSEIEFKCNRPFLFGV